MPASKAPALGEASGKVILLGEHTVVYGAPAIAAGIERGARASASELPERSPSSIRLGDRVAVADASSSDDLARAFAALLAALGACPRVSVVASSDLPPGGGLGSSAAIAVAVARALLRLTRQETEGAEPDLAHVLSLADAWERVFHGNPSGIDTAAAGAGGCFRFSRADGRRLLDLRAPLWLCVGHSGESSSTRVMVEGVARLRARKPELVDRSIAGAASLVENAALAIEAYDLSALGKLMDLAQMLLAGLLLSTEPIERMCAIARESGALGAKLTGSGGGGSVIALVPTDPALRAPTDPALRAPEGDASSPPPAGERVLAAWRDAGYSGFLTRAGIRRPVAGLKEP